MVGRPRSVSDDEILAAGSRVIARVGPARLTLSAVADEVGLRAPTLVQRFGTKRGLMVAVSRRGVRQLQAHFDAQHHATTSASVTLIQGLTSLVEGIESPAELANHLGFLQLDLADDELRVIAAEHSRILLRIIQDLLDQSVAANEINCSDTARLARTVYSVYNGSLIAWALDGSGTLAEWLSDDVAAALEPYRPT